jgi:hypothetical protein
VTTFEVIEIDVRPIGEAPERDGIRWFRFRFRGNAGQCFITAGEALRLRELTVDWVRRALANRASARGLEWLESTTSRGPGLQLHYRDADDEIPLGRTHGSREEEDRNWRG